MPPFIGFSPVVTMVRAALGLGMRHRDTMRIFNDNLKVISFLKNAFDLDQKHIWVVRDLSLLMFTLPEI